MLPKLLRIVEHRFVCLHPARVALGATQQPPRSKQRHRQRLWLQCKHEATHAALRTLEDIKAKSESDTLLGCARKSVKSLRMDRVRGMCDTSAAANTLRASGSLCVVARWNKYLAVKASTWSNANQQHGTYSVMFGPKSCTGARRGTSSAVLSSLLQGVGGCWASAMASQVALVLLPK